jgi:uncharacterized protein YjiS (DUF1127 family)
MGIRSQNPLQPHRSVRARVMTELSTRSAAAQVLGEASAAPPVTNVPNLHRTSAVKVVLRRACYFVLHRALFWRDYYQVLRELDGLSELDLRDMGVTRAEISFLAWSEACRRYEERRRSVNLAV